MEERFYIHGEVQYIELESGFWGITDKDHRHWLPVNLPEQLKVKGKKVIVYVEQEPDFFSFSMWGSPVRILSFQTS